MKLNFLWGGVDGEERREGLVRKKLLRLEKLLGRFSEDNKRADVKIYKRDRWGYRVKFDMQLPGRHVFAEERGKDLIKTVVAVRERVKRQIRGYIERMRR